MRQRQGVPYNFIYISQRCQRTLLNFTGVVLQLHWPWRHNKSTSRNLPNVFSPRVLSQAVVLWTVTQNPLYFCDCWENCEIFTTRRLSSVTLYHRLVCKPHARAVCIRLSICNHFERNYEKQAIINSSFSLSRFGPTTTALSTISLPSGFLLLWHMLISKHIKLPV